MFRYSKQFLDPSVTVRLATEDDIEGILHMSRISHKQGYITDYVPGWLPKLLKDENRVIVVAEKDKQIIGSMMLMGNMDGGLTIQGEAGRTHPDHQDSGIMASCSYMVLFHAEARWPKWQVFRGSSTQTHFYDQKSQREKIDLLTERTVFRITLNMAELAKVLQNVPTNKAVRRINHTGLKEIMSNTDVCSRLYPEGLIMLEHSAFNCDVSNWDQIASYHDAIFIDGSDVTASTSISIGGAMSCDDERAYRYNFNYSGAIDLDTCLSHLYNHMKDCARTQLPRENVYLIVMLPNEMGVKYGVDAIAASWKTNLHVSTDKIVHLHQYVFEYVNIKSMVLENLHLAPKL